ncbi:hypothetical protein [Flavobacterium orientale]|uniref:hypothetical protein n=1 Tax=Flavobacterium orientale TaxID=1756020 RepID=UPI0016644C79|nr:hypothetical protein [Flavobacterium orientale]
MTAFYSSIIDDYESVYVITNDFHIHAIDKKTLSTKWSYYLATKSNVRPVLFQESILVGQHKSANENYCVQLNAFTGDTIKTLKINRFETTPNIKDNILFGTAINPKTGGSMIAYDLNNNSIVWQKFIAHGYTKKPYYFNAKIIVNAEKDNWFTIDYYGNIIDTICTKKNRFFDDENACLRNFKLITFDEKELKKAFLEKHFKETSNIIQENNSNMTVLMANETLLIIGKNKKILQKINLNNHIPKVSDKISDYSAILKIDDTKIWFFYNDNLATYDIKMKIMTNIYDLKKWNTHQLVLDLSNLNLWLISKNDGQLYGLKLNQYY